MAKVILTTRIILSAGTATEAFDSGNADSGTFTIPGTFTGTTMQPQYSNDDSLANWTAVGSAITVATNGTYDIPAAVFSAKYGRLVAGSSQAADRSVIIAMKR